LVSKTNRSGKNIIMIRVPFVFGAVLLCGIQLLRADQPFSPDQAIAADGKRVSMRGVVSEVVRRDSGYIYVNIGGIYPAHTFAVRIHKMDVDQFPNIDTWAGKEMIFSGVVEVFNGKPSIRIRRPEDTAVAE